MYYLEGAKINFDVNKEFEIGEDLTIGELKLLIDGELFVIDFTDYGLSAISEPPITEVTGFLGLRPKIFFLIQRKLPKNTEEFRSYIYSNSGVNSTVHKRSLC